MKKIIVTGAGGFIGHHLVKFLKNKGEWVRGIDLKKPEFTKSEADEFIIADLRDQESEVFFRDADEIYALASDVGGVGYLAQHDLAIFYNNHNIDLVTLNGALKSKGKKILFVSSACIYPTSLQGEENCAPLKEADSKLKGVPENIYGMEKLLSENMFLAAAKNSGLNVRIVRPQNVYGHEDNFQGGKEKAIGALCYKTAVAKNKGTIEIWGDGKQKRSFCFVEDLVEGMWRLMKSNYDKPLNISIEGMVEINHVADILNKVSGKNLKYKHNLNATQGVRGRQSDLALMKHILKWEPKITLQEGLQKTYEWVVSELKKEKHKK
jgi:GDP-D-mannose 3', 5'-epimerase